MTIRLDALTAESLDAAARQFENDGYFLLEGASERITNQFRPIIAE